MPEIVSKYIECYVYRFEGDEIKYLLLKRSESKQPYPGIWQIVTGKIEKGEKAYLTALREVKEETGLEPVLCYSAPKINEFYTPHNDKIYLIPVFAVNVKNNIVKLSDEHVVYEWLDFNEAYKKIHWYSQKENLIAINKMLSGEVENTMIEIEFLK